MIRYIKIIPILSLLALFSCDESVGKSSDSRADGQGGSMARFTIADGNLYVLDESNILAYSLDDPSAPSLTSQSFVANDIETIFPYNDKLFIGSQTGMHVFNADPSAMNHISSFSHIRSCDPVVADDNYAFITLNTGSMSCFNGNNVLQIVDISDLSSPKLVKEYEMTSPQGLGIDGDLLFVCDNGLKVYDRTDVTQIKQIAYFTKFSAYDVIPMDDVLFATGDDGLQFYSYKDNDISLLSTIPVKKEE